MESALLFDERPISLVNSSPLRWAGSKKRLLKKLCERSPKRFIRYIEPFAGSAVLFYALKPREAVLSDINSDLIDFYRALRRSPIELHNGLSRIPRSKDDYLEARSRFVDLQGLCRSSHFWYLNRCCFNGIYRTNRNGVFNVPFGSKLPAFPTLSEAVAWSKALHSCDLLCTSFGRTIESADAGDFVYLDPPYARRQQRDRGEYGPYAMQPEEMWMVIESALRAADRGVKVLISYNIDLAADLLGWRREIINVRRDVSALATGRNTVSEFLFSNY